MSEEEKAKFQIRKSMNYRSVETHYMASRDSVFDGLKNANRRDFLKISGAAAAGALASGVSFNPHSFQPVSVADAAGTEKFSFAYISDSHLYKKESNDRFVRSLLRAVDDVNALDPQPDFVFYGGDLAQLGQTEELELGAQILKSVKAPVKMMVGEHDWYLDMGAKWRELFGPDQYSWNHKGVHFVVLNSVVEKDFWTARGMSPMERMQTVAGLDNGVQSPFTVGDKNRAWLKQDLAKISKTTPLVVFSHSPLYKLYKNWNFWTDDAEQVQGLIKNFKSVTVIHGHTHQMLTNRIGNMNFHGLLSTAWPWPYAPEGMPKMNIQMGRPNPFDAHDGCGDGIVRVHPDHTEGLVDKVYSLWNRNPIEVTRTYMKSNGKKDRPPEPSLKSY